MEIVELIGEWFISTINGLITQLGFPVTIYTQIAVVVVAGLLILLIFTVINEVLIFYKYRRDKEERETLEAIPPKMTINENAAFQNGMTPMLRFPVIFRLLDSKVEVEEDGETLGYFIQPSPEGERFLFFEGKWEKLAVIQSLHHLLIDQIEKHIQHGVKISEEESTPPDHFEWNGTIWKIERVLPFAVRVVEGDVYSFPSGKGAIELIVATPYRKEEQENGAVVLERQFNSFRNKRNETWMGYHVSEITEEEVKRETGEAFERLDLSS